LEEFHPSEEKMALFSVRWNSFFRTVTRRFLEHASDCWWSYTSSQNDKEIRREQIGRVVPFFDDERKLLKSIRGDEMGD
jgi:hypothetical protein